ncbi:MAG: hypothetical protein MJE77_27495 [Proteobacteria bacterium]|nr:hypothetical protein [Pseudomonadota bacterium]
MDRSFSPLSLVARSPQRLSLILAGMALCLAGCAADRADAQRRRAPRPRLPDVSVSIPDNHTLTEQLAEAVDLHRRRFFDRMFDALDPGEGIEHATLTQDMHDRRRFGLEALFVVGDELFEYEFRVDDGLGNGLQAPANAGARPRPNMRRIHRGGFGGPDSYSCATCHFKGGPDGAGTNTQNAFLLGDGTSTHTADERNAPHLLGLGPVQALAIEMTGELTSQLAAARQRAAVVDSVVEVQLSSKGVSFGVVRITADDQLDMSGVRGVDRDLVIRPFGWKGHQATIRGMSEESFRIHLGVVSSRIQELIRGRELTRDDYGDGPWHDVDRDGVSLEIDAGMLTTMVAYLSQLEIPVIRPPRDPGLLDKFARGSAIFDRLGCAECHRRSLVLHDPTIEIRPAEPRYASRPPIRVNVAHDGEHPKIEPRDGGKTAYHVRLFSDLRRHDMGEKLATRRRQGGVAGSVFLTRPLWGLAETAPYLHDGRAPTVHDAIRLHGGEASAARNRYLALTESERACLRVFLLSLSRIDKLAAP